MICLIEEVKQARGSLVKAEAIRFARMLRSTVKLKTCKMYAKEAFEIYANKELEPVFEAVKRIAQDGKVRAEFEKNSPILDQAMKFRGSMYDKIKDNKEILEKWFGYDVRVMKDRAVITWWNKYGNSVK